MTREQIERFVEALERLVRSDLVEIAGMWRRDIEELKATYRKIEEEGLHWERLLRLPQKGLHGFLLIRDCCSTSPSI
jgi:hypothetical protein